VVSGQTPLVGQRALRLIYLIVAGVAIGIVVA
jgi:hypothetical protein